LLTIPGTPTSFCCGYLWKQVLAEVRDRITRGQVQQTMMLNDVIQRTPDQKHVKFGERILRLFFSQYNQCHIRVFYFISWSLKKSKKNKIRFVAVTDFARKTGDFAQLSATDLGVLALAVQLEIERNGESRIRTEPAAAHVAVGKAKNQQEPPLATGEVQHNHDHGHEHGDDEAEGEGEGEGEEQEPEPTLQQEAVSEEGQDKAKLTNGASKQDVTQPEDDDMDTEEGWITVDNLQAKLKEDSSRRMEELAPSDNVVCVTTDYAMQVCSELNLPLFFSQCFSGNDGCPLKIFRLFYYFAQNVLLQMNVNLIGPDGMRIRSIRQYALKCQACFKLVFSIDFPPPLFFWEKNFIFPWKGSHFEMHLNTTRVERNTEKKFCSHCGNATLYRVAIITDKDGRVVHYNSRPPKNLKRGTQVCCSFVN
jgi:rRNA maturation endonuclease Nob1